MSYRKHLMTRDESPSELYKAEEVGTNLAEVGMDAISKQQARDALNDIASELHERGRLDEEYIASWCAEKVEQLPPIQLEPKRGKWIRVGSGSLYDHYECSECGKAPKWECMGDNRWKIAFTDFCPNCGAKMEVNNESN